MKITICTFVILLWMPSNCIAVSVQRLRNEEIERSYWRKQSEEEIKRKQTYKYVRGRAQNAVILIGDGMGISTVTAGRIYMGQSFQNSDGVKQNGESFKTAMEQLPVVGLSKTYSVDHQTTDSAASATAYLCGVKARTGTLGVDAKCRRGDCMLACFLKKSLQRSQAALKSCTEDTYISSVLKRAHAAGKWTGIVTTTRVTHASPAGAYAHSPERYWETYDGRKFNATQWAQGCRDIAHQLIHNGSEYLNVIFGGGLSYFLPANNRSRNGFGVRADQDDLIEEWIQRQRRKKTQFKFIRKLCELDSLHPPTKQVLGLFAPSHMSFSDTKVNHSTNKEPSLAYLTQKAIEILSKSANGYVLFVEGGLIDVAHHKSQVGRALDEFSKFDEAVKRVLSLGSGSIDVDTKKTLVVVTSDHSHMFAMGANGLRNADVLGFAVNERMSLSDVDKKPVFISSYGNGPGYVRTEVRLRNEHWTEWENNRSSKVDSRRLQYPSAMPLKAETHGGEDVPVYSVGPGSHLLSGTFEQSLIANVIAYSTCISPYQSCEGVDGEAEED